MPSKRAITRPFRRFALTIAGTVALLLLVFTALNTWINPLWVTPTPWTDEGFAEFRPIYRYQRTAKAGLVRSQPWDAAFLGSSRIDIAFDPALPQWGETRAVNLAVSAGSLPETAGILRYTLEHSDIDLALVGVDIGDLFTPKTSIANAGFMESPFNPKGDAFERELRYLAGISTFESSIKALSNRAHDELPEYTPQGHRLRHQNPPDVPLVMRRDAVPHALRLIRGRKRSIKPDPGKVDYFQQILDDTKAAGCRLVLVIPPSHGVYLATFHYAGDPDPVFSKDRRLMAERVAASNAAHPDAPPATIWDFNDFHPLNCEDLPEEGERMHWWVDGTHARKELGTVMLSRIMGWDLADPRGEDYGFRLTADRVDERGEMLRAGYQRFRHEHPQLFQWMVESAKLYQTTDDPGTGGGLDAPPE
jgi:hypothetical protein